MSLSSGTRLGPYEIVSRIGAGGMGEVYRATDTRLGRAVAIKVISSLSDASQDLRQRFEREARAVSSLSHPHICTLYDVGQHDGSDFLVMELLEGESLASRLAKGPLPPEEVLRYGIQIADALSKAHRKGIIHRDLKPGNIMITKSGAKLLDFGLAKVLNYGTSDAQGISMMATEVDNITAEGTLVGTFQYMSPEQLEGKEIDARTDLFAFGTVLYEMTTGQNAFTGKSRASIVAAVLSGEPVPVTTLQPMTPPALDRLIRTCLSKDPDNRWQNAHDVMLQLTGIAEAGSQAGSPVPVVGHRKTRRPEWIVAALFLLAVCGLSYWIYSFRRSIYEVHPIQSYVLPPENRHFLFEDFHSSSLTISPDGRWITFAAADSSGKEMLWLRAVDSLTPRPLSGTEKASHPFWSPDSQFLAFFADGKLKKINIASGPPISLCSAPVGSGGSWNAQGEIVFAPSYNSVIHRVPDSGGTSTPITKLRTGEDTHHHPTFLPNGRHFLYTSSDSAHKTEALHAASVDGKVDKRIPDAPTKAAFVKDHFLFVRESVLMAQKFDPGKLELQGKTFPVVDQIYLNPHSGRGIFSASINGMLIYHRGTPGRNRVLWLDRSGKEMATIGGAGNYRFPKLSADGKKLALVVQDSETRNSDIWVHDLTNNARSRLTFQKGITSIPAWSSDGDRIFFSVATEKGYDMYQKMIRGTGKEELLASLPGNQFATDSSPDGRYLTFTSVGTNAEQPDVWILPLFGERKPFPFVQAPSLQGYGIFSPDGHWIAYNSDESGKMEVYAVPFPQGGRRFQITTNGGSIVNWPKQSNEIFVVSTEGILTAVEANTSETSLEVGPSVELFRLPSADPAFLVDVSPDGKFVLIAKSEQIKGKPPLILVSNWPSLAQR